jgi:hypothetical protein
MGFAFKIEGEDMLNRTVTGDGPSEDILNRTVTGDGPSEDMLNRTVTSDGPSLVTILEAPHFDSNQKV